MKNKEQIVGAFRYFAMKHPSGNVVEIKTCLNVRSPVIEFGDRGGVRLTESGEADGWSILGECDAHGNMLNDDDGTKAEAVKQVRIGAAATARVSRAESKAAEIAEAEALEKAVEEKTKAAKAALKKGS